MGCGDEIKQDKKVVNRMTYIHEPKFEYLRTNPDEVVFVPKNDKDGDNEHFFVFIAPKNDDLIRLWTQSSNEGNGDNRLMLSRPSDGGSKWSAPKIIIEAEPGHNGKKLGGQASKGFPIINKHERIYIFFYKAD